MAAFSRFATSLVVALSVGTTLATAAGCGVVDVGPDTGPPAGCNAPPQFFVSDVWPRYFERYTCGKSDCHDSAKGRGSFRLQSLMGVPTPAPTDSLASWPTQWRENLRSVQRVLNCANPLASQVLTVPSGRAQPHPPGVSVTDIPDADALFTQWLK